jgi:hypothetical protein
MTLAVTPESDGREFAVEDLSTGMFASGFGHLGDGRSFSFHVHRGQLVVEVYHARLAGPVPHAEDVVAAGTRNIGDVDVDDERSLIAALRDAVADARPVPRPAR